MLGEKSRGGVCSLCHGLMERGLIKKLGDCFVHRALFLRQ